MSADPSEREARVLGSGPRIPPLGIDAMSEDLLTIVTRMIEVNQALDSREQEILTDLVAAPGDKPNDLATQLSNLPEIVLTMLRHPELFARQTELGIQLLGKGSLAPRDRELVILRMGWLCQAPYEWGEHVHIAKNVGISSTEIEAITEGAKAETWNEHERALLSAVEELYQDAMISDETWATLSKRLNERQLIELPIVIGQYQTVAYYQNSLRLRLHEGNQGLAAR